MVAYKRWLLTRGSKFDLETFGILKNWSLRRVSLWIKSSFLLAAQNHNNNNDHKNNINDLESDMETIWCSIQQMQDLVFFKCYLFTCNKKVVYLFLFHLSLTAFSLFTIQVANNYSVLNIITNS